MKISIVTVSYNSVETIGHTMESVLSQIGVDLEYIIIDGGSMDGTLDIIQSYSGDSRVRVVSESDEGIYDAMNKGVALATGDVIGILNSDDFYATKDVLGEVVERFKVTNCQLLYGDIVFVDQHTLKIRRKWVSGERRSFLSGWHPPHPSLFVSSEVYRAIGVYETRYRIAADFEFMLRAFEIDKLRSDYLRKTVVHMRLGGESTGSLQSIFKGHREIRQAFNQNNVDIPILYPIYRYVPKLIDFIKG